jgi:hypothetical protein
MHKLAVYLVASGIWLASAPSISARTYGSLKVTVVAPNGRRIEVPVEVIEKGGRKLSKLQHFGQAVL